MLVVTNSPFHKRRKSAFAWTLFSPIDRGQKREEHTTGAPEKRKKSAGNGGGETELCSLFLFFGRKAPLKPLGGERSKEREHTCSPCTFRRTKRKCPSFRKTGFPTYGERGGRENRGGKEGGLTRKTDQWRAPILFSFSGHRGRRERGRTEGREKREDFSFSPDHSPLGHWPPPSLLFSSSFRRRRRR